MCKFGRHSPVGRAERANNRRKLQFNAFKFRTTPINGDEIFASFPDLPKELALNHKLKNNPRITRLGIFLRKTAWTNCPSSSMFCRDMHDIRNWSIWLDLQILFPTVPALIKMREHINKQNSAKLAASTLYRASRRHAPYGRTLLVKPYERLIILATLFIGMR